jgi:hypothetical protein
MNTTSLARQYDALTPWERLPLIVAAEGRGDEVECERLAHSAPRVSFCVANCWGLVQGLDLIAKQYLLGQLDLAEVYWRVMSVLDQPPLPGQTRRETKREERLWRAVEVLAYRIVVQADGWREFCRQLQMDPDALLKDLTGREAVRHIETLARDLACTSKEAHTRLRAAFAGDKSSEGALSADTQGIHQSTSEDVARAMRKTLEDQLTKWS